MREERTFGDSAFRAHSCGSGSWVAGIGGLGVAGRDAGGGAGVRGDLLGGGKADAGAGGGDSGMRKEVAMKSQAKAGKKRGYVLKALYSAQLKPESEVITVASVGRGGEITGVSFPEICDLPPYSTSPTLCGHPKRIAKIQTAKKHRAQVENLKKARAAKAQRKREGG